MSIKVENKEFLFKEDIPVFYFIGDDGIKVIFPTNQTNIIRYSFNKEICKEHALQVVDDKKITALLKSYNIDVSNDPKDNFLSLKLLIKTSTTLKILPYNIIKSSSNYIKDTTSKFLKEIECFIDIKFIKTSSLELLSSEQHSISLCSTPNDWLNNNLNVQALTTFAYNNQLKHHYAASILFDGHVKEITSSLLFHESENTVKHEILHALGLDHPHHSSLEDNKKYRSIVEDTDDINALPISNKCIKDHKIFSDRLKCMKSPTALMPVDVKALISIWGPSNDNSAFCKNTRSEFIEDFLDYMYLSGKNADQNNALGNEF